MRVEIWSDLACPWCYIGKRRFEAALARFAHAGEVEVVWRSFELDPSSPRVRDGDPTQALADKYGISVEQAAGFQRQMTEAAAGEGLSFRLSSLRRGNTFDAHRLMHLAAEEGLSDAMGERLFSAYLGEGRPLGDPEVLIALATEAGVDPARAGQVLASDLYAKSVRADEAEAATLGISAVPFFVVDRTFGLSGAQSPEVLLEVLERAWAREPRLVQVGSPGTSEAGACEDGSCAVPRVR